MQKNRAFPVIIQGHREELGPWGWARVAMPSLPISLMPETVLAAFVTYVFRLDQTLEDNSSILRKHDSRVTQKLWFQNCYLTC